jgi:hypothetical protein
MPVTEGSVPGWPGGGRRRGTGGWGGPWAEQVGRETLLVFSLF